MPADKTTALFHPFDVGNLALPDRVVTVPVIRTGGLV